MAGLPIRAVGDGVLIDIRLTPRASADVIRGIADDADGVPVLSITVTAPPADGKANMALVKLLAKACRLPKSSLSIASGATSRRKVIHVAGTPGDLMARLQQWARTIG